MAKRIQGMFNVKMTPQAPDDGSDPPLGRMLLDKQFQGDLAATSKGQMLAAGTAVEGSAGYVALERVTGTLAGRSGTFVLIHTGLMNRGAPNLAISVVPDSGTGELAGLSGTMGISFAGDQHLYDFEYDLPDA